LNKKREALRRGLRSFIEDTSRELADLEGRELEPAPDSEEAPRAAATTAVIESPPRAAPEPPMEPDPPRVVPVPPAAVPEASPSDFAPPSSVIPLIDPQDIGPSPEATEVPPPRATSPPAAIGPRPQTGAPDPPHRKTPVRSPRRPQGAARRQRARIPVDLGIDGISPEQARGRKGVCFAYFLNPECWRVPQAYCNSALQVCITRECPVYRLHKDAFERRFAKKFRHFW
jgi:hypothetical protein